LGNVEDGEMYKVFNMGLGMLAVVPPDKIAILQAEIPEKTWIIGEVIAGEGVQLL